MHVLLTLWRANHSRQRFMQRAGPNSPCRRLSSVVLAATEGGGGMKVNAKTRIGVNALMLAAKQGAQRAPLNCIAAPGSGLLRVGRCRRFRLPTDGSCMVASHPSAAVSCLGSA